MQTELSTENTWHRRYFEPSGNAGDAELMYVVFGDFGEPFTFSLDKQKYRSHGLPSGSSIQLYNRASTYDGESGDEIVSSFYDDWFGRSLQAEQLELFHQVERAPSCLFLRGTIDDPSDLLYLRDVIGVVTGLLDYGSGVALLDLVAFRWFTPGEWQVSVFAPDKPYPRHHVTILVSEQEEDTEVASPSELLWVHTRGLRKFGRPDISVHNVPPDLKDGVIELCDRFIEMLGFGSQVPDGQEIRMSGLPKGLVCHTIGSYDDPDFNNVRIEITGM